MQIKRLRLSGFKSFVDPADLRIEPGLTGIVGPNGCGKSNLLEALRWAMGEASAKSMRGAGMEDVIFAGTATRPPRDFAEVSILADGDAEELEVVRRIERGAGSAYRVNGRDVRARDVALLFADAATGAHSPALVSQGRIGAVIAAKPADRRQMLEEAAGIAGLHVRRREAEQRLRATEANLVRLGEVIADQDSRLGQLRRQARQAERYRQLSEQIRVAEARMIFARWRDAARDADLAKADAARAEAEVIAASAQADAAEQARAAMTTALADARAAALAAHDRAGEARHRLDRLRAEQDDLGRRIAELGHARQRLADDRAREGELARDAAEAIGRLAEEARVLDAGIKTAIAALPAMDRALAAAEAQARDAEVALAQALAAQASEAAEARVARAALDAADARVQRAERDALRITSELAGLSDPAPLLAARDVAIASRDAATAERDKARLALTAAQQEEQRANDASRQAQSDRAAALAELASLDAEAAALTRATQPSGKHKLVEQVAARPGYERALAGALGDDLEDGLDTRADRHWAGASPQPGDPSPPAGAVCLADQVDAPPELARRLAQVFVVEQDEGQPLAVGQRLVTLAGVLRRWDGYVARSSGAAAAERLQRINRLRAIDRERPDKAAAVERAAAQLADAEAMLRTSRSTIEAARRAIETSEAAIRNALRDEDRATAQLERIEGQRADLVQRQRQATSECADADAERARAANALAAQPDGSATRARVAELSASADSARQAVAAARSERTAADAALARDRERLSAAQRDQKGWQSRAGEAAKRIAEMDKREAAIAAESDTIAARPDAIAGQIATAEAAVREAVAAADAARLAEQEADRALRSADADARQAMERLAAAREARAGAVARAENHELRRIEMGRVSGERFECPPPLLPQRVAFDAETVRDPQHESAGHERLTLERERIGPVNLVAEAELTEIEAARAANAREQEELTQAVHRLRGSIGTLNREGRQRLLAAFEAVNDHFRALYSALFNGGSAHLALIDSDDPLEAGLEIMAQPPGKKLQSLTLLSGGEQALTAVALIFALFLTNPAPICVLDEVDAPLDDANIDRFCDLLDRMVAETRTRYLIVTHNAATMSRMHRLFGVTMVERGVSRLVSVDLGGAETLLAAE